MHPERAPLPELLAVTALAVLRAACGGAKHEASSDDDLARPLAAAPAVAAPRLDNAGNVITASDSAQPADNGARTRHRCCATPAQAAQQEDALDEMAIAVSVESGSDAARVLVRGADLRRGSAAVLPPGDAGYKRVFPVTR